MNVAIDIAELRAEMARRLWRQQELADRTGLSRATVAWILRGAKPSERAGKLILKALGEEGAERVIKKEV
jgi:transcriptional regulator with XRE-family HTH domain